MCYALGGYILYVMRDRGMDQVGESRGGYLIVRLCMGRIHRACVLVGESCGDGGGLQVG